MPGVVVGTLLLAGGFCTALAMLAPLVVLTDVSQGGRARAGVVGSVLATPQQTRRSVGTCDWP